jgi:glyoxylase-like metal-dependent hydrolase (beta-lactamase superfamily II)
MIKISDFEEVKRLDMARTLFAKGRYWTTAYFVDGLMIDTGCAHTADELDHVMRQWRVNKIVNTHGHEDHIGANGLIQHQRSGVEFFAHPLALEILREPRANLSLHPYQKVFWGYPEASKAKPIRDGDMITTEQHAFRVIHTPGHSPDHICLYEAEMGWLFTGDLFVGGKERALRADYDIWGIIDSLKEVAKLPITWMFPGSARVREDPHQELQEKIVYLEDLGDRTLSLHAKGWKVNAITKKLCGSPIYIELLTLGHFSRRNLILSYLRGVDRQSTRQEP